MLYGFQDTTNEQRIVKELVKLFTCVHNGKYPNTEFYTQVVQFNSRNVGSLNFVPQLCTIIRQY